MWRFGFLHKNDLAVSELIQKTRKIDHLIGPFFNSSLFTSDDTDATRHYDYFPLINSRIHKFGDLNFNGILNETLK